MLKKIGLHLIYIAVIFVYAMLIGCPLYRLTGINCPFCGMTRAHLAFFKGDIQAALGYNSLFYLGIPVCLGFAHLRILRKHKVIFYIVVAFVSASLTALIIRYLLLIFN